MQLRKTPPLLPSLAFTHGGRFHADDVFSAALLKLLRADIRIYRGFELPKGFSGIVFDIGDGKYDHHMKPIPRRENGMPYAAFGLLWKDFGECFLSKEQAEKFDEKFVQPLDLDDNNGTGHLIAGIIASFNPPWDSKEKPDEAFEEAVDIAGKILEAKLNNIAATERGTEKVTNYLAKMQDNVIELEEYMPWKQVLIPSKAEFVIFPSMRGGFTIQCVPSDFAAKSPNKVPLPSVWRGQPAEKLAEITGLEGFGFCHASGFLATTKTTEEARQICTLAKADFEVRQAQSLKDRQKNLPHTLAKA